MLDTAFFDREVTTVARELLGATFLVDGVGGIIVETEAYHPADPASHSYSGPTPRNATMFAGPGRVYVYRSYGIHWCVNFVCSGASAVLIRALQPTHGLHAMTERRGLADPLRLCSGPGKLCQALAVTRDHDGLPLAGAPFSVALPEQAPGIVIGPRIGISKAVEVPWRFGVAGSPFLSRKFNSPVPADSTARQVSSPSHIG
ncbi:MAG TPA: DNA-3-methyladenine glycosylase [Devosiaceae bacterium]|nr:DNA-3-methyladenine glycosylase [Devosiaceae bacterium]